ncbi:MAG TPA: hypothetical protein VLA19_05690 [Herpetosiphonaceae bacterium]|nr:hypothetical protein [Herpetosiphonaceae bacterium]
MSTMDSIARRLRQRVDARLTASRTESEDWADDATDFMRQNAPWEDQTGEARRKLRWVRWHPKRLRDGARIALVHGASHGRYLELAHGGRLQIMGTTMAVKGPELLQRLRRRWR